jgi:hypothetical protein
MQIIAQLLISLPGDASEPSFNGSTADIAAFFASRNDTLFKAGDYVSALSVIPLLCFLAVLSTRLRRAEGDPAWLSLVAFGSGLVVVAGIATGSNWEVAVLRQNDGVDPQIARLLFDQGNLTLANLWVMFAPLAASAGLVALRTAMLPRWLAWLGIVTAVALIAVRAVWADTDVWYIPFGFYYLWLAATSVVLVRQRVAAAPATMPAG